MKENETVEWYYDSGAYEHVTNDKNLLKDYKEDFVQLRCADNTTLDFEGYGSCEFTINNYHIKLNKVLYSKKIHKNLISAIEFAKIGITFVIEPLSQKKVKLTISECDKNVIGTFLSNDFNQFKINTKSTINNQNILLLDDLGQNSLEIWNRRMGHQYIKSFF